MTHTSAPVTDARAHRRPTTALRTPGLLLGLGMGGFVDGIVLHQILQWHQMLSTTSEWSAGTVHDLEVNVLADGLFHAATWLLVAVGIGTLWRVSSGDAWRTSWRDLLGWMLVGWGVFNLVEGVVNHHVLQIHRVRPDAAVPLAWDLAFLVTGVLLAFGGLLLRRTVR